MKIIGDGGHAKVIRELISPHSQYTPADVFIAIGDNASRKREAEKQAYGCFFPSLMHSSVRFSHTASIGEGTVLMAGVIVQANARIGKHCIINTGATIDHDCVIGDYAHIAPGAHLCGNVHIGEGTLVGVGVGIAPGCKIPAWSLVKARRLEIVPLSGN